MTVSYLFLQSGTEAEKRAIERAMKAADRHLKLDEKRQTRITAMKMEFPNLVREDSNYDSSSTSETGQQQHQFLMSSSSTPQLPSIIENENSVTSNPNDPSVPLKTPSQEGGEGKTEADGDDDNVSWGIPMSTTVATHSSHNKSVEISPDGASLSLPSQEAPTVSTSPSKKKKRKQKPVHFEDHEGKETGAAVDAPHSSISGVSSSLTMPSAESGAPPPGSSSEIPQLPPISLRNRLSGFFTKK